MFGRQLKLAVHHSAETIIKVCHLKRSEIHPPRISWVDILAIHSHVWYRSEISPLCYVQEYEAQRIHIVYPIS